VYNIVLFCDKYTYVVVVYIDIHHQANELSNVILITMILCFYVLLYLYTNEQQNRLEFVFGVCSLIQWCVHMFFLISNHCIIQSSCLASLNGLSVKVYPQGICALSLLSFYLTIHVRCRLLKQSSKRKREV
jgi:hypothetical protein